MITNKNYNIDLAELTDEIVMLIFQRKCISMKELQVIKVGGTDHL